MKFRVSFSVAIVEDLPPLRNAWDHMPPGWRGNSKVLGEIQSAHLESTHRKIFCSFFTFRLVQERLPRLVLTDDSDLSFEHPILRIFRKTYVEVSAGATTGWFKHTAINWLGIQCPRHFGEIDPENQQTCSMNSCQPVAEWDFYVYQFCFARYVLFLVFFIFDVWVLGNPKIPAKQMYTKKNIRQRLGKGSWNTCANNRYLVGAPKTRL